MPARPLASLALLLGARGLHVSDLEEARAVNQDSEESADPHHKKFEIKLKEANFDCSKFPDYCRGPFNCHLPRVNTTDKGRGIATADGHANYQKWCGSYPRYSKPMTACVSRDYDKYARLMHDEQEEMSKNVFRPHMLHVQSQLCFLAGHCNDTKVNEGTTARDMEKLCDARWGHKHWTEYNMHAAPFFAAYESSASGGLAPGPLPKTIHESLQMGLENVFSQLHDATIDMGIARAWSELSCGMGSYHCDVHYCKQKFCSDPTWRSKHLELSWAERPAEEAPKASEKPSGTRGHKSMEEWQVLLRNKLASGKS